MLLHYMGPIFRKVLYPSLTWRQPTQERVLYLTFDDGPIPEVTEWVMDQLARYQAQATFFCVGDNIRKHPEIYQQLLAAGHATGNHTFHHLNGWQTTAAKYWADIQECQSQMDQHTLHKPAKKPLFRPPYGRISRAQIHQLQPHYRIVMWEVLSGDFSAKLEAATCWQKVKRYSRPGSIIVFHDSQKAFPRLQTLLPQVLAHYHQEGYRFEAL